jgi:hypothetical protein
MAKRVVKKSEPPCLDLDPGTINCVLLQGKTHAWTMDIGQLTYAGFFILETLIRHVPYPTKTILKYTVKWYRFLLGMGKSVTFFYSV